jgi:hypothetical protein
MNGMASWLTSSGSVHEALSILGSGIIGQMQHHVLTNIMAKLQHKGVYVSAGQAVKYPVRT